MGYSIWEFYDDYMKGHKDYDALMKRLKEVPEFSRESRYLNYMIRSLFCLGGDELGGLKEYLADYSDLEDHEFFLILKDENGNFIHLGNLPKGYTLKIKRKRLSDEM